MQVNSYSHIILQKLKYKGFVSDNCLPHCSRVNALSKPNQQMRRQRRQSKPHITSSWHSRRKAFPPNVKWQEHTCFPLTSKVSDLKCHYKLMIKTAKAEFTESCWISFPFLCLVRGEIRQWQLCNKIFTWELPQSSRREGTVRVTKFPPKLWPCAKTRLQVLNPFPQKVPPDYETDQNPLSHLNTAAIHPKCKGTMLKPGCLATHLLGTHPLPIRWAKRKEKAWTGLGWKRMGGGPGALPCQVQVGVINQLLYKEHQSLRGPTTIPL